MGLDVIIRFFCHAYTIWYDKKYHDLTKKTNSSFADNEK